MGADLDALAYVFGFVRMGFGPWWSPFAESDLMLRARIGGRATREPSPYSCMMARLRAIIQTWRQR